MNSWSCCCAAALDAGSKPDIHSLLHNLLLVPPLSGLAVVLGFLSYKWPAYSPAFALIWVAITFVLAAPPPTSKRASAAQLRFWRTLLNPAHADRLTSLSSPLLQV